MRKMAIALTAMAAILIVGSLAWKADAQTTRGAAAISDTARNFTPIEKAACWGRGRWCGPGWTRVCGPRGWHCWCRRC